jgi:6-phosphofructokinase
MTFLAALRVALVLSCVAILGLIGADLLWQRVGLGWFTAIAIVVGIFTLALLVWNDRRSQP